MQPRAVVRQPPSLGGKLPATSEYDNLFVSERPADMLLLRSAGRQTAEKILHPVRYPCLDLSFQVGVRTGDPDQGPGQLPAIVLN